MSVLVFISQNYSERLVLNNWAHVAYVCGKPVLFKKKKLFQKLLRKLRRELTANYGKWTAVGKRPENFHIKCI